MIESPVVSDLASVHERFANRDRLRDSSVIVTGAGGFLGYYLVKYLATYATELGLRTVVAIDPAAGDPDHWLARLGVANSAVTVIPADVASVDLGEFGVNDGPVYVVHAASIASPTFYRLHPLETIDANIWGLRRMLDSSRSLDLRGFLFFSSSEIYGDPTPDAVPTNENYRGFVSCTGPRACYDESKRFGETMAWVYAQQFGTPITIARPFNNFGPGMAATDKRLPADLAARVVAGADIEILSSGTPTRTFCYVTDALVGYLMCLVHGKYDYFNIGNASPELSVMDLARMFQETAAELWGYAGTIHQATSDDPDYLTDNPQRRCPDLTKAAEILGYRPEVSVSEGVRRYLSHQYLLAKDPA